MANISMQEVRSKYPQYDHIPDQELADKLHEKFYSKLPKDEFYNKIGFSSSNNGANSDRNENIKNLMEQTKAPGEEFGAGVGQGLANIAPGIANLGIHAYNGLTGSDVKPFGAVKLAPDSIAAKAGDIGSMFLGPNPASVASKIAPIANALQKIGAYAPKSANVFKNAIQGATQGAVYNPENQTAGAVGGGSLGVAAPVIGNTLEKGFNALRPSNLFRGNLTPEQLEKNLNVTKGTETNLGDVIGSPFLKRQFENVLSKIPFSGANESMMRTAGDVINRGHGILDRLTMGHDPANLESTLNDSLKEVYKSHHQEKSDLYTKSNKIADDIGLKLELPNFANAAKRYSASLENTNVLKHEPEMAAMIKKLSNYKNPVKSESTLLVNSEGKPFTNKKYPRLEEANLLKGKLNQLGDQYSSSTNMSDRHAAQTFYNLAKTLKNDIQSGIKKTGNQDLHAAYNEAEKNYAEKFSPFLDKEIYKFAHGDADPDTLLSAFIKTGKSTDRAGLLDKLMSKLPPDKKNVLGAAYLQRALDENNVLNPLKLKTLISKNSLGRRQFETLFPNRSTRNALRNYVDLVNKNTKGLEIMENPKTGQMNTDILGLMSKSKIGLLGKVLGARPIVNALTSETTRNNLVNKMIKNSRQSTP